jgi:septal ring factor EnvC (AmiA/AmiB activator)
LAAMGIDDVQAMVDRMRGSMQDFRTNFDEWTDEQVAHLEQLKQTQDAAMAAGEDGVCGLMERQKELEEAVGKVKQKYTVEQRDIDVMNEALEQLKAKQQTLPPKLAEAERVVAEEQAQLDAAATRAWARPTFSQSSRGLTRMCLSQSMS